MANRPVFCPGASKMPAVQTENVSFVWNPGLSITQKQRNVRALHAALLAKNPAARPLEISSKSTESLGVELSAFNLGATTPAGRYVCAESIYQASKVFAGGRGPFPELYAGPASVTRKKIAEIKSPLVGFRYGSEEWPLNPTRAFYDWIYCKLLALNPRLVEALHDYTAFTDIEFNPQRSVNCQAYAVALYLSLERCGFLEEALSSRDAFLKYHPNQVVAPTKSPRTTKRRVKKADRTGKFDWADGRK